MALKSSPALAEIVRVPTHKDKPDGFDAIAARRSAEAEAATERARLARMQRHRHVLAERDQQRAKTSVPPPPHR